MPNGKKVIPKPWWYPWGEAQWRQDPRSKGMVKLKPGVWGTPPVYAEEPAEAEEPGEIREIIKGELFLYPDGTYRDRFGIVVANTSEGARDWYEQYQAKYATIPMTEAERRGLELEGRRIELAEAQWRASQAPETLTPWQKAQLEQQERQWKARELARPENWIERWFYENMPRQQAPRWGPMIGQVPAQSSDPIVALAV